MKISIITTVNHNVGDDFVREGIIFLLKKVLPDKIIDFQVIHKHCPISSRYGFESFRRNRFWDKIDKIIPLEMTRDRVLEADLLVQSGAPVYWYHGASSQCVDNEWFSPLIRRRYKRFNPKIPFINLAAGSCQCYYSDGSEIKQSDANINYIQELHSLSAVTTVRDTLAKTMLNYIGLDAPVIPCSSIFARDNLNIEKHMPEFVALNFMENGAHYSFEQNIDGTKWFYDFQKFYEYIRTKENCVFVCHNKHEINYAKMIDNNAQIFYSNNYVEYVEFYSKAKFGIVNRVHGAFMLASFGKPSFVIGTDSRAVMAQEIGLRHEFVSKVDVERLILEYQLLKQDHQYEECFEVIKAKALNDYFNILNVLKTVR